MRLDIFLPMISTPPAQRMEQTTQRNIVRAYIPWLLAAGMLLVYLITLNKSVSLSSVLPAARGAGLDWHPALIAPFAWLVTLPVRWVPGDAQLLVLNLIGSV